MGQHFELGHRLSAGPDVARLQRRIGGREGEEEVTAGVLPEPPVSGDAESDALGHGIELSWDHWRVGGDEAEQKLHEATAAIRRLVRS